MRSFIFSVIFLCSTLTCSRDIYKRLCISTSDGPKYYFVEVADSKLSRVTGLMFRKILSRKSGMLFIYNDEKLVAFWMKNMNFAIDLIFIADSGMVTQIEENALPGDIEPIKSSFPIIGVLELSAGTVRYVHIMVGDFVSYSEMLKLNCEF